MKHFLIVSLLLIISISSVSANLPTYYPLLLNASGGGNITYNITYYGTMNQTPNMTPGAPGADGMMNQTPNLTALDADMTWNISYFLRDNSRTLTGEKMRRDVDNDLFSLYGGNSIAGGMGGILSLFGKDTVNPYSVEINVGDGGAANTRVTGWVGGANPRMDMNNYNISSVKDPVALQDAATRNYVNDVNTSMRNNASANFVPMVNQLAPTVNLGGAGADATKYLRGDQTWQTVSASAPTRATAVVISSDFYEPTIYAVPGLLGAAIGSGTTGVYSTTAAHPGVIQMSDSTTAGGGWRYGCTATGNWLLAGGESFEFVFQTNGIRNTQNTRAGWSDSAVGTTLPVDGVYFNLTNVAGAANWTGNTASNSVRKQTNSKFAGSAGTWYRGTIAINAAGTLVTYTIYNEAGVSQWTDTLSTSIPTGAGRDTSPCIIATEATTDAAAVLLRPDYAKWEVVRVLTR